MKIVAFLTIICSVLAEHVVPVILEDRAAISLAQQSMKFDEEYMFVGYFSNVAGPARGNFWQSVVTVDPCGDGEGGALSRLDCETKMEALSAEM